MKTRLFALIAKRDHHHRSRICALLVLVSLCAAPASRADDPPSPTNPDVNIYDGPNGGPYLNVNDPNGIFFGSYSGDIFGLEQTGTLNITAGQYVERTSIVFGYYATGVGRLTISDGEFFSNTLYIGLNGSGIVSQTGGTVTATNVVMGKSYYLTAPDNTVGNGYGTYTLSGGTLVTGGVTGSDIRSDGSFTPYSAFTFNGGALQARGNNTDFMENLDLAQVSGGGATIDTSKYNVTISQTLVHASGQTDPATDGGLTKLGSGTLTLTGTNTYNGGTTISAGRLVESDNGNALSTGKVSIASGTTLELHNDSTSNGILQAGTTTFTGNGTLQKTGAGTVSFGGNGGNVNVSLGAGGNIDVQAGTLLGSSSYEGIYTFNLGSLNIASGATFDGVEAGVLVDALTGNGTLQGGYNGIGSTTIGVNNGSGTFSGVIRDGGGVFRLVKAGTGTETLTGANTFTGTTLVSGGTLALTRGGSLSGGLISVGAGATFSVSGTGSVTGGASNLIVDGTSAAPANLTTGGSATLSRGTVIVGGMGVGTATQSGGSLTASSGVELGINPGSSGTYTLGGGTLTTNQITGIKGTSIFHFNGGTLRASQNATGFVPTLSTFDVQAGGAQIDTQSYSVTIAQALTSGTATGTADGGLTKLGSGTLTFSGASTYTGATNINAGTLLVNGTSTGTGTVTVQNSGSVLGGTGTVSAPVNVTTGTLNPGTNAGTNGSAANVGKLTVGALTLSSTAMSSFDVNSGTAYDQVQANGNIALGNSTLTLVLPAQPKFTTGQVLDLFHANGGLLTDTFSDFSNLRTYSIGGESFLATYTQTDFTLTALAPVPEPATWLGGALLLGTVPLSLRRRRGNTR